jgi:hypothetical protein
MDARTMKSRWRALLRKVLDLEDDVEDAKEAPEVLAPAADEEVVLGLGRRLKGRKSPRVDEVRLRHVSVGVVVFRDHDLYVSFVNQVIHPLMVDV